MLIEFFGLKRNSNIVVEPIPTPMAMGTLKSVKKDR